MRGCFLLAVCVCAQSVVAATFVGQANVTFQVTERLDGTTTTANRRGLVNYNLTTDYSTMRWSMDFDVDLLMAGGPEQPFETRLLAKGSLTSRRCQSPCSLSGIGEPSPLSFPNADGASGAGSFVLLGTSQWTLTDRIVTTIRERDSPSKPILASGYVASNAAHSPGNQTLWIKYYPNYIILIPGFSSYGSWQDASGQWQYLSSVKAHLGRIGNNNEYVDVTMINTDFPTNVTLVEQLPGDFSASGAVDAGDYVVWRKSPGPLAPFLTSYDVWRGNFGNTAATNAQHISIPEPATSLLALIVAPFLRRRTSRTV